MRFRSSRRSASVLSDRNRGCWLSFVVHGRGRGLGTIVRGLLHRGRRYLPLVNLGVRGWLGLSYRILRIWALMHGTAIHGLLLRVLLTVSRSNWGLWWRSILWTIGGGLLLGQWNLLRSLGLTLLLGGLALLMLLSRLLLSLGYTGRRLS